MIRDIEESLRTGLLGFQELEIRDGRGARPAATHSSFFAAASLRRAFRPVYRDVCRAEEIAPGSIRGVTVDGVSVLLVRVDDELFACANACGESPLPLDYSTLDGTELRCSWHGCRYDVRTGHRLDRPNASREEQLTIFPARVSEGVIQVVVGTAKTSTSGAQP